MDIGQLISHPNPNTSSAKQLKRHSTPSLLNYRQSSPYHETHQDKLSFYLQTPQYHLSENSVSPSSLSDSQQKRSNKLNHLKNDNSTHNRLPPLGPLPTPPHQQHIQDPLITNTPNRRLAHILSEQKRRENINSGFEELKSIVPSCRGCADSKAVILRKAVHYIQSLESEVGRLKQQANSSNQSATPSAGSSTPASSPPLITPKPLPICVNRSVGIVNSAKIPPTSSTNSAYNIRELDVEQTNSSQEYYTGGDCPKQQSLLHGNTQYKQQQQQQHLCITDPWPTPSSSIQSEGPMLSPTINHNSYHRQRSTYSPPSPQHHHTNCNRHNTANFETQYTNNNKNNKNNNNNNNTNHKNKNNKNNFNSGTNLEKHYKRNQNMETPSPLLSEEYSEEEHLKNEEMDWHRSISPTQCAENREYSKRASTLSVGSLSKGYHKRNNGYFHDPNEFPEQPGKYFFQHQEQEHHRIERPNYYLEGHKLSQPLQNQMPSTSSDKVLVKQEEFMGIQDFRMTGQN
ncbi:hypothetical protein G9A89_006960 [Geosiphon pyriformis]|nr:hypothetical protein G9A89_006960 [Geosiphon pyriformis]